MMIRKLALRTQADLIERYTLHAYQCLVICMSNLFAIPSSQFHFYLTDRAQHV